MPRRFVERGLEREQREHPAGRTADGAQPLRAPRPHRRAHEMDGTDAPPLQAPLEPEIEIGRVDADEQRNARGDEAPRDPAPQGDQSG